MSVMRPRPSRRLNSEWTWRCVKSFGANVIGRPIVVAAAASDAGGSTGGSGRQWLRARRVAAIADPPFRAAESNRDTDEHEDEPERPEPDRHLEQRRVDVLRCLAGGGELA